MSTTPDTATKRLTERSDGAHLAEDGIIYGEEVRYCWIDEDGTKVSPVHKDFGKALSWISDWPMRWDRLDERATELQLNDHHPAHWNERERENIEKLRHQMTTTGKRPVRLRRLVLRTTTESLIEHERDTVEHVLRVLGLEP